MNKALYFLLGVACGAAGAYFYLKDRYEANEKEFYTRKYDENEEELYSEETKDSPADHISEKPDLMEYAKKLAEKRYVKKEEEIEESSGDGPYVITKDQFGDNGDEYETVSLTYYSDGTLAYEIDDEEVDDADEIVGNEFIDRFGEYEDNMVFVRNDAEKIDFEIFKDERTYEEVSGNKPHRVEVE